MTSVKDSLYWNTMLRLPLKVISFALSIVVARLLNPSDFGIMAIVMMIIAYANQITNVGMNETIVQQNITCRMTINSIFTMDLAVSVIMASVFFASARKLSDFFREPRCEMAIKVMCAYFILSTFYGISHAILRSQMRFKALATIESLHNLATGVLSLVLAYMGFGFWSLALGQIVPLFLFTILLCAVSRWLPVVRLSNSLLRPIWRFGLWNFAKSQINFAIRHIDTLVIGRMLGTYPLGLYDKALNIAVTPSESILMNINSVMFSAFSRSRANGEELRRQFAKAFLLTALVSGPLYLGLIAVSGHLVHILLGPQWQEMLMPLRILCAAFVFKSFGGVLASFNIGVGQYRSYTLRLLFSGVSFAGLCFAGVRFGIEGVAWAYFFFSLIEFLLSFSLATSFLKVSIYEVYSYVETGAVGSFIMFVLVLLLSMPLKAKTELNLLVLISTGCVVYCSYLLVDRNPQFQQLRSALFSDLRKLFSAVARPKKTYLIVLPWDISEVGGVNEVAYQLYRQLERGGVFRPVILINSWSSFIPRFSRGDVRTIRQRLYPEAFGGMKFSSRVAKRANAAIISLILRLYNVGVVNVHFPCLSTCSCFGASVRTPQAPFTLIISFHGRDIDEIVNAGEPERAAWERILAAADGVTTCSYSLKEKVIQGLDLPSDAVTVIHNGASLCIEGSISETPPHYSDYILSVGTFEENKGQDILISAFAKSLHLTKHRLHLLFVGRDTPYLEVLKRLVQKEGLTEKVLFFTNIPRKHMPGFYKHARFFILPSRKEAFGIAILEAGLCGLPVIASRTGGVPEIITDTVDGRLFSVADESQLLALMLQFISGGEEIVMLGSNLKKKVQQNFTWERMTADFVALAKPAVG